MNKSRIVKIFVVVLLLVAVLTISAKEFSLHNYDFYVFGKIFANDWSNVSINASQIKNGSFGNGIYFNKTSDTYNGSLSYNGLTGYDAGHAICNASFEGTHMCNTFELLKTKELKNTSDMITWDTNPATCYAHVISGGPKYAPATIPFDDCEGWTNDGNDRGANFYIFCSDKVAAGTCGPPNEKSLACCKVYE